MKRSLASLTCLALLFACKGEDEVVKTPGRPVSVEAVVAVDVVDRIEASGQILAKEEAEIAAEVGGRITEIFFDEGDAVAEDEAVLAIDPERRTLQLDSARARLDEARAGTREEDRELKRIRELRGRNITSQTQLDQAETALKRAKSRELAAAADLGIVERALRDASVKAPFSGLIAQRFVSRGEYVNPGQKLYELVSLDPIEVEFRLTEVDSSRVQLGQTVDVRVAPYPEEDFHAKVTVISPTIDPRTRTLRVKALMQNPDGRLRPGLFARVDLGVAHRKDVPMIPEEAILQRIDGAVVFRIVESDRVERLVIQTGLHDEGRVEVVEGMRAGDQIVSRGHRDLTDGALVVLRNHDGTLVDPPVANVSEGPANTP